MERRCDSFNKEERRRKRSEEYRGVTLMPTLYKIYMMVLVERIRKEVKEKGIVPKNQTGFRKGMETMDNIYVLNYMINRQLKRRIGRMTAMFVDLKAAFDSVDRGKLMEAMEESGIRKGLKKRMEEVLEETRRRIKVGGELEEIGLPAKSITI